MASQDDAIPSLFFWMTAGALCFSSSLAAISTWELLSGDATISIHLTRTSIAQLVVPDILAFVAAWRLRYITSGKARWENEPRRLLLGIMIAQFAAAFIVMVGLVQTGEKPGGSRALLALLVLLISISRETVATRKLQAADEATNPDEQEPLLQQRQRETSTRNGAFTATVGRQFFVLVLWMLIAYSAMQRALDSVVFPPAGKLVRIRGGNQMVHIQCQGEVSDKNAPTILLESGLSIPNVLSWKYVIGPLSNITRVCSIDRPGYGASESGPLPQTTSNIAEVMKLAIDEAGEPGPFVLVGHSFGGYNIRSFAHTNPQITAGIVFLDASHEDAVNIADEIDPVNLPGTNMRKEELSQVGNGVVWGLMAPFGLDRVLLKPIFESLWNIKLRPIDAAAIFNGKFPKAITSELIHYVSTSADQARATKPPRPRKDLPVSVVVSDLLIAGSCDRPDAPTDVPCNNANATATAHYRCQKDLAKSLSEDSSFYVTRGGAGHFVMLDDPTTVISAVVDTFERAWRRIAAMKDGTGVVEGLGDLKLDLVEDMQDDDDELEFEEEEPEYDL